MKTYIKADGFYYPDEVKAAGYLDITDGKFGTWSEKLPADPEAKVIDHSGSFIAPGLVETHIHGFKGADAQDHDPKAIFETMSDGLLSAGVTSFLPTPLTDSFENLEDLCRMIAENVGTEKGAKVRGIHFEGPFFTEEHKGAQNPKYMCDPSVKELDAWLLASKGLLKKIDLAPERPESVEFIKAAAERGVYVFLGHSNATYKEAEAGVNAGARGWVHTYNGMRGLSQYEPGMLGAALNIPDTYNELICDGHHVRPEAAQLVMKLKGADHVVLITDSMRAAGLEDGFYSLGEYTVEVRDGAAWLPAGNLAASTCMLKTALKNVVDWGIASPEEAVKMATLTPAKSVGIDNICGQIKTGLDADFIVLTKDMTVQATYLNGEKRYESS